RTGHRSAGRPRGAARPGGDRRAFDHSSRGPPLDVPGRLRRRTRRRRPRRDHPPDRTGRGCGRGVRVSDPAWSDARELARAAMPEGEVVSVNLASALGSLTTSDLLALGPIPHAATSAMDGWAVSGDG